MRIKSLAPFIFLAAAVGFSAAQASSHGDAVAKGKQEYDKLCIHCHGATGEGDGKVIGHLKITPADLTALQANNKCVAERVLMAVLGKHAAESEKKANMPLLADSLSPDKILLISQYIKSLQK